MKLKYLTLPAAALALAACSPSAPTEPAPAPEAPAAPAEELLLPLPDATAPEITAADIGVRVKTLADDVFEGRGPGTPTGEASAAWIAQELARIGLEPAGDDGTWYQQVEMVNQTIDPASSSLVLTWPDQEELSLDLKNQAVIWTKRQNTDHISFEPSDVVFVGYGAVAPEYEWDDYAGQDYTGKTVLILVNDPGFATEDPELFNGKSMTYYGRWTYKYEEAARQGATAAIVIHETEPAAYGWDVVANSWTGAQSDLVRPNGGEDRAMMEGWVQRDIAVEMFAKAGLDFEEMKAAAKTPGFQPVALEGVKARGEIHQTIDKLTSRNVAGVLPGTTTPDEYVLYTAHWDHLGMKTGAPGEDFYEDQIYNGAVDNATGAAGILEIAEAMKAQTLQRSAMFLFVTLEESGLLGSEYFANNPTIPLNKVVAGINLDGALPMGRTKDMTVIGFGASELEDILKEVLVAYDRIVTPDGRPEAGYFYRSDHISLAKKGVPMLYAGEGEDKREGGIAAGRAAAAAYTAERYHKPMDEYSDDWDLSGFEEDLQALYDVGLRIANSDTWPTWYPGNEFEAARKESLAGE
ncbi:peptidase, family M28 [Hyphomonas neptunium ATCC 15444]|uniref:Peptidase, family M28 n=2 Tax=Hyphomonas TaxID=85 RepID=Q0C0F6_HYPNA|nr:MULTISPECIES: M28 family metallopeptidase [Hyphomonas]ABI78568.1 peptidase, family M28 [Hyphomonas neptunium ATCC 15444]KCZ87517.1 M28 family peptidase [Hyphomonas hirschiana VP5]